LREKCGDRDGEGKDRAAAGRGLRSCACIVRIALNDLLLRGTNEIYVTDTEGDRVFRFDRESHRFTELNLGRPVFGPNGITVSDDGDVLYVGDDLGVIRMDLRSNQVHDVKPAGCDTMAGIDGLYWYKGSLVGVEYGTGAYRVVQWKLSTDGGEARSSEALERGTEMVRNPTTGAIMDGKFYFMANTGIANLENGKIDPKKLEPLHIAVVTLEVISNRDAQFPNGRQSFHDSVVGSERRLDSDSIIHRATL